MSEPVRTSELTVCFTATNSSAMTLAGTNTYLIGAPDSAAGVVLVDPGERATQSEQLEAVTTWLSATGQHVELILITHHHADHTGAVDYFHENLPGTPPVRAVSAEWTRTADPLPRGETLVLEAAGTTIEVIPAPGHTSDSIALYLPEDATVITGDTTLGQGTTMLDHPDGSLRDYLNTLEVLGGLESRHGGTLQVLPAHGPVNPSIKDYAEQLSAHRMQRVDQIETLLAELEEPFTVSDRPISAEDPRIISLTDTIYPMELPHLVRIPAQRTVAATVEYVLTRDGGQA